MEVERAIVRTADRLLWFAFLATVFLTGHDPRDWRTWAVVGTGLITSAAASVRGRQEGKRP